ncbi:hypothetical protein M9458_004746, partial [Cirrhinus mrigala]
VSAVVDCPSDSVLVSWSLIAGAENYSVTALGSGGQTNHCNISSLQCGQQFNVTFTSTNHQCQMSTTTNVTFQSSEFAKHYVLKALKDEDPAYHCIQELITTSPELSVQQEDTSSVTPPTLFVPSLLWAVERLTLSLSPPTEASAKATSAHPHTLLQ